MKYVDEFRAPALARGLANAIQKTATRPWVLMEVCGGQTHSIVRSGLDTLVEGAVELVHGPGCPVCVTPVEVVDRAHAIALRPGVIFTSFGDMLRVPGSRGDLLGCRARGADVRTVYSPLDAVKLARENPGREVVFFGVGFETTAPATALAVDLARRSGVANFSLLAAHVLVPPAIRCVLERPANRVQAFLGPGHVCTVVGLEPYRELARTYRVPIVVAGFEPVDILEGILRAVRQLEAGQSEVENQYARVVPEAGNAPMLALLEKVFEPCDRPWRGMGTIPLSGYRLTAAYADLDAERRFPVEAAPVCESAVCMSGLILSGEKRPTDCPAFGTDCTPETPLGATMVSSEGACAAYFAHGRRRR